jgi:SPP1 gp7 family putative phage head morphogenesis protein
MLHNRLALDQSTRSRRDTIHSAFSRARRVEVQYATRLRKIADHVGEIINGFDVESPDGLAKLTGALERYAVVIAPWAEAVGARMLAEVNRSDAKAWEKLSSQMSRSLQREIRDAPTGARMRVLLADQVKLITSLPTEAAQRVQGLTQEALTTGRRAEDIAKEIARSGEVTKSRATLIARTEVSRSATTLSQVRAQAIGSTHFVWRTSHDSDVRPSHRALDGKSFRWDDPPECDPGHHALPGCIWNCRCLALPQVADAAF